MVRASILTISQDIANHSFVAALKTNGTFFDQVDMSPNITVAQTLALEELSQFFAQVLLAQDDEAKKKVEEETIDKILEKILTKVLETFEKIDKEAAEKIAGQVVGAFRTLSETTNTESSLKLKFAYLEILKGGHRSVEETQLAITAFVNLIFNTAGIGGKPLADFVKLIAAIKLSSDYADKINKNANAGNYANLIAAMKADIAKEEKAQEDKNKNKKK